MAVEIHSFISFRHSYFKNMIMAKRYLDPKADLTFKRVFGEHKNLLMSLLNSLLPLPEGCPIVEIEYQSPELVPDVPTKKDSIVDVRCVDSLGRSFAVEMQMYWTTAFKHRALLNTAKAYTRQLDAGGQFAKIQPVYTLSFVNDLAFPGDEEFYHRYLPTDSVNPANTIDGFEMVFIELPKFANWQKQHGGDASVYSADGSVTISRHTLNRLAVLWCRFLTEINEHTLEVDSALLADEEVGTALGIVEQSAFTDGEMYYYERYWDTVSRERTALEEATARGAARGWEEGLNRGREEGLAAGRAAGRADEKKKLALNLLNMGMAIETVAQATELSIEEIKDLTK